MPWNMYSRNITPMLCSYIYLSTKAFLCIQKEKKPTTPLTCSMNENSKKMCMMSMNGKIYWGNIHKFPGLNHQEKETKVDVNFSIISNQAHFGLQAFICAHSLIHH